MKNELEFLQFHLEMASIGEFYGNHTPMDVFSKKLLEKDWIKDLKFSGYSSSRVDFEMEDAQYENIYVYTSFKSILSGKKDRVTIRLGNDYYEDNVCFRDNIKVKEAVNFLEQYVKEKSIQFSEIEVDVDMKTIIINLRDEWGSINQMKECINKIKLFDFLFPFV